MSKRILENWSRLLDDCQTTLNKNKVKPCVICVIP